MISHRVKFTIRSMTIRTPSSLKWLINQYQNQSRQLREIEKQIEQLSAQRSIIVDRMSSFAKVIEYHDIPITADDIPLLRSSQKQTEYKYGQMTVDYSPLISRLESFRHKIYNTPENTPRGPSRGPSIP